MAYRVLAALGLAACSAVALHMLLPARWRLRVDAGLRRLAARSQTLFGRALAWRREQRRARAASLEADRVIRRAREAALRDEGRARGEWRGNVYHSDDFDKPRKPH
ncbi:MAG: hypothetical protein E6Q67_01260 [Roseateles sp.]|nr:MAG: hypothetical protein E6Q67_01260 [Roseateles sp.]